MRPYKLTYWNVPGRGESIRMMLALGDFDFENDFTPLPFPISTDLSPPAFDVEAWMKLKPKTPWGTLPTLTLPDGTEVGQQRAILRYLGKLSKHENYTLYPDDPVLALKVDGLMDMLEDIWPILVGLNGTDSFETAPLLSTMFGKPYLDDFISERMKPKKGDLALMFDHIDRAYSEGPYLLANRPSCADVLLFAAIAWWGAGMFPSMDIMLSDRPNIQRAVERVGTWGKLRDYYLKWKSSRSNLPKVGVTNYEDFYKNFHSLCGLNQ
mgnify:FL=1